MLTLLQALRPVADLAGDLAVITTMSAIGDWPADADLPRVFHFSPSSMGQGPSLALGLALALPQERFVVLNGDGCMLMNLGSLATIASQQPANLAVVVIDNGIYEVTGGQPIGGAALVDHCGLARSSGFRRIFDIADPHEWSQQARAVLNSPGPVFVRLAVEPRFGQTTPKPPRSMAEQILRFRTALAVPLSA